MTSKFSSGSSAWVISVEPTAFEQILWQSLDESKIWIVILYQGILVSSPLMRAHPLLPRALRIVIEHTMLNLVPTNELDLFQQRADEVSQQIAELQQLVAM